MVSQRRGQEEIRERSPAGGGYTTAADLMKFAGALMSNKLLKAETLAEATRAQFTTGAYGFGFQIGWPDEARSYGQERVSPRIVT